MRVLVTGGAGFIGSHTTAALLARGDEVVCLDNFHGLYYDPALKWRRIEPFQRNSAWKLYQGDIRDTELLEEIFEEEEIDKIIHIAALAGVRNSLKYPQLYEEVNVKGTLNVLEMARKYEVENFVFASSSSVYGERSRAPFREDEPADWPVSPYAATKRTGELLCHTYYHLYDLPTTCLRFFTVYGPWGRPDMAMYIFTSAIFEGRDLPMFGDGTSERDYTFVDDIVAGVLAALDANLGFEIINLGNCRTTMLRDFIALIEEACGRKAHIRQLPTQPGDVGLTCADIAKAQRLLGYDPQTPIEEGVRIFVDWYRREMVG
ncbi:MAG: GDP-mannose 4,6-dehydratase [Chloroflexota bacterium]|nr:GDP-mannose 4,6-dehydratase [Chloroflexota bacterium]